jgi:hypothetical protein
VRGADLVAAREAIVPARRTALARDRCSPRTPC